IIGLLFILLGLFILVKKFIDSCLRKKQETNVAEIDTMQRLNGSSGVENNNLQDLVISNSIEEKNTDS
ncbi:MAG: hypothetical protein MHPSP_003001, partial [Paramarteilia canceri]